MNKILASAFLAFGAVLTLAGYFSYLTTLATGASNSGSLWVTPSDTTVWLVIFGLLFAIAGAFSFANEEERYK